MTRGEFAPIAEPNAWQLRAEPPPDTLTPDTFAERLYLALAPLAQEDEDNAWALLILCNAVGTMFQLVEDLVRDTPDGPGWSALLDLWRAPDDALPWLAQFAGVRVLAGSTPDQMRQRIASTDGFRRGTRQAMIGAARATLTGAGTVLFYERNGANMGHPESPEYAYCLGVITYDDQTPNPQATLQALLAQKPGGILLEYGTVEGQTWQQVKDSGRTWRDVRTDYATWREVRADEPA